MSTTVTAGRFTRLPDEHVLQATVVALEEHGFGVEVVGDLDAARQAVLARIPEGSSVMTTPRACGPVRQGGARLLPSGRSRWDQRVAAHAEIFILLAGMTDDPVLAPALIGAADVVQHLVLAAGSAADGMIISSRQRLLAYLRAGDPDGAAMKTERHLPGPYFVARLAGDRGRAVIQVRRRAVALRRSRSRQAPCSRTPCMKKAMT